MFPENPQQYHTVKVWFAQTGSHLMIPGLWDFNSKISDTQVNYIYPMLIYRLKEWVKRVQKKTPNLKKGEVLGLKLILF